MIRLVIADKHTMMREGLRRILQEVDDIEIVGEAADGQEALHQVRKGDFDELLLDLSLPGGNGLDLIRQIRQEAPKLPVLVLTMHDEERYAIRTIRAGAQGYLTKESAGLQLVNAIRTVAAGNFYITRKVAEQLAETLTEDDATRRESLPHQKLSDREFEVFTFLVSGKSISDIASRLRLSRKTISSHKAHILKKMDMRTPPEVVLYAAAHQLIAGFD